MGGEYSTYEGDERCMQGFGWETWGQETNFGDLGVDGRKILSYIFRKSFGGMDWIDLAQARDRWRALVNAIMNFGFNEMWEISWLAQNCLASVEGLCSTV